MRSAGARASIARLTGLSLWRGFIGFYNSDDLTYAASIAYYALLSLFPFFLLAFALLGRVTADDEDRDAVLDVRPPLLSHPVRFHHHAARRLRGNR